jgi:hypothetical protein
MVDQSTTEGQPESVKEPVLEAQEVNETPGNLEPENEAPALQNLEKSEATVAHDDAPICHICGRAFTWDETVQAFSHDDQCLGSADLEAALNESEDVVDADWPTECAHGKPINDDCEKCEAADMGKAGKSLRALNESGVITYDALQYAFGSAMQSSAERFYSVGGGVPTVLDGMPDPQPIIVAKGSIDPKALESVQSAYGSVEFTEEPGEAWITKDGIKEVLKRCGFGDQPDGSCGFIVKVQEGYVDAVRQWAEADGVPVERWLSDRLYEYVSTYGDPAQSR